MEGRESGARVVKLVLAHEDTVFQYTLYPARSAPTPLQPSCNVIGGPGELVPSLPAGARVCEASAAASVGSIRPTGVSTPGRISAECFLLRCCPHPWIRPGRAAGQHVSQMSKSRASPHPVPCPPLCPTPSLEVFGETAAGKQKDALG